MKIFVRNVGADVTRRDLATVVGHAARPPWYRFMAPAVKIQQCDVLQLTDELSGGQEYHGFVELAGADAHKVLMRLNRMQIRGHPIDARRWLERSGPSDRRRDDIGANLERRQGSTERRRKLKIDFPRAFELADFYPVDRRDFPGKTLT